MPKTTDRVLQDLAEGFWKRFSTVAVNNDMEMSQVYEAAVLQAACAFIQLMTATPLAMIAACYDPMETKAQDDGQLYSSEAHLGDRSSAIALGGWFIKQMRSQRENISSKVMEGVMESDG